MMYSPDKMMGSKGLHGTPISAPGCFPSGRYSPPSYRSGPDNMPPPPPPRRCMPNPGSRILEDASIMCNSWSPRHNGDLFGGLNSGLQDGLLSRAEALAADLGKHNAGTPMPLKHDPVSVYHHGAHMPSPHPNNRPHHQLIARCLQMSHPGMESLDMLDPANSMTTLTPMSEGGGGGGGGPGHHGGIHGPSVYGGMNGMMSHHHHANIGGGVPHSHHPAMAAAAAAAAAAGLHPDADTDPRELEAFAERFKQRRIKLGVTQADVGKALANLKLPGVGALSQSTICRFESLTLSHNNMIALKPILQAWLEEAEAQAKNKRRDPDAPSVLPAGEKKRKRTSIAAPEKRSLEAFFAVQPRPSGEKIAAIAEKLDLKKNVVRVWFCNQRQKQKRMKFAAQH
ncbi:inhibitory POU protein isoform X2 [Microplitis mediator]|uniref:inhibitory POU protein isoform X2 n=1 Tax=Microplitis mediator TaxID=375433 RepID=UPI002556E6E0|nr:inhibitory POU protein isoform X2 [Microplitis mediator]